MVANILPTDPPTTPSTLRMGPIGQNSTFSEHGHIAYLIKWNHEMQQLGMQTPLPHDPRGWGQLVKIQHFQTNVTLHIKLKEIRCPQTHLPLPRPWGWGQ